MVMRVKKSGVQIMKELLLIEVNCLGILSCISSLVPSRQLAPALISHLLQVVKSRKKPPKGTNCLLGQ